MTGGGGRTSRRAAESPTSDDAPNMRIPVPVLDIEEKLEIDEVDDEERVRSREELGEEEGELALEDEDEEVE